MPGLGAGIGILGVLLLAIVGIILVVLIILMPVFIYLMHKDIRIIREILKV